METPNGKDYITNVENQNQLILKNNANPNNSEKINNSINQEININTNRNDNLYSEDNVLDVRDNNINKENKTIIVDNFIENNINIRNIIDDALFSQLSKINVKLLVLDDNISKRLYNSEGSILPKIDFINFTLLNQSVTISELQKYGFGLYVFFLYLINLLITFGILFIFAFHYMYCIFYKYYRDYEDEYSLFFDYNLLSLVSGTQIIRFRKYYIEINGKDEFLEKYRNFDVIYKEYIFTGTIVFIVAFLSNFIFVLYLLKTYKLFKIRNPEMKNYTLILSGKEVPYINGNESQNDENVAINNKETATKNKILNTINVRDADINFTFKFFKYYEKMEKMVELREKKYKIQYRINKNKCCCYACCCFCGCCFCCCCKKKRLIEHEQNIDKKIDQLKKEMNEIKSNGIYNPLHIITFNDKNDYDRVYSQYPHSYIINSIKNCFKSRNNIIYVNKAPNPEDIVWKNLEFDNEYKFYMNKFKNFGISLIYVVVSFIIQLLGEIIDHALDNIKSLFIINIIVSYLLGLLDSLFNDKINYLLTNHSNSWSYSDIKFYSILFQSIFKFINKGIFPLLTYYIIEKSDDNYSDLVSKMFIIIEMDGFGYPMVDLLFNVILTKGRDMYESTNKMMSLENIEEEIDDKVINKKGLSRLELEQSYEKKEMDLEGNYSDILAIYWITMFYLSIYPIGVIQSFLNLLFKYIIEKNFLLNVYKRPDYINPQFGFLCFNFFNFGFFLFLCGNIIFFRNEDNKNYFGVGYIVFMFLILLIPFYLLAKFIMWITKYCGLKEEESENLNDIKQKLKSDYRLFNPCYQREKIDQMFLEFKRKNLLTQTQYEELKDQLNKLNDFDLYKLQQNLRVQKFMSFEERKVTSANIFDHPSIIVDNEDKKQLYYFLMQLGFISYLEEGNVLKPSKKKIEFEEGVKIRSISLKNLSIQENFSNSDSGYFTTFKDKNKLIMVYVDNERNVKIFDIFDRRILNNVKDSKHIKKIVCVDYFTKGEKQFLLSIALDNTMIITDLSMNEKDTSKIIQNIGDTYNEDKPNNTFCLSTIRHEESIWIITSYYYDKGFKIYNSEGNLLHFVDNNNEYIISLEGLFFTEENTYICIRTPSSINLFINQFYINQMKDIEEDSYINFKIIDTFIIFTVIKKDLSLYSVQKINIMPIFPYFTKIFATNFLSRITFFLSVNKEVHIPMNQEIQNKITKNSAITIFTFSVNLNATDEQREAMIEFMKSENNEKFNIGNILLWDNDYIIVGTPFNYLDILDCKNQTKVGVINNIESIRSLDNGQNKEISDIITYNISEKIYDPQYGESFIMRDNKGKIQYIRLANIEDKLNYRVIKLEDFNNLEDEDKLEHIMFSTRFLFLYCIISFLFPLILAIIGHNSNKDYLTNEIYITALGFYITYSIFGIWFKGCVYDLTEESHTKRTCTKIMIYLCLGLKIAANSMVAYRFCLGNKTGIIFVGLLLGIYFIHWNFNFIIYFCKIKFLLRTYWLGFLFYQISRFCILIFFILSIVFNLTHVETYVYAGILCIILIYMYITNYFNTLMKDMVYNSYIQAIFNYPFEWMNIFCCWHEKPKDIIREIDIKCCVCDSFFLTLFQVLLYIILILIIIALVFLAGFFGAYNAQKKNDDD